MKISKINYIQQNKIQNKATNDNKTIATRHNSNVIANAYPQNYYLSFGSLNLNDFIKKHVESGEMPATFQSYCEDQEILLNPQEYAIFCASSPQEIQRAAFEKLQKCRSVEDIKKAYPNEEAFKTLKQLKDVNKYGGRFFSAMKKFEDQGIKTLKCEEDITTFIVKKIYYDGMRYNKIGEEIKAQLTPEVKEELTQILNSYNKISREMFEPLGIKAPDGRTYISDMQTSKPRINAGNSFANATPEEINERIQGLLEGAQKARYTMMDAWNHCEKAREDLSNFLHENMKNAVFDNKFTISDIDIYDGKFYSKMRVLMIAFWNKYPQHKEELGKEIKFALERYNSLTSEELIEHIRQITQKSSEIRKAIQEKRIDFTQKYPNATILLEKISTQANPMSLKTQESNNDFFRLLLNEISKDEFEILESDINSPQYKALIPQGMLQKMRTLCTKPEYCNISNAQKLAIMQELLSCGYSDKEELEALITKSNKQIKDYSNNAIKKDNIDTINETYNSYKMPLTNAEIQKLEEELRIFKPELNDVEEKDFKAYLKTQGKYLIEGINTPELKNITQIIFWQGYDIVYNSNKTQSVLNNININHAIDNAFDALDALNFEDFE